VRVSDDGLAPATAAGPGINLATPGSWDNAVERRGLQPVFELADLTPNAPNDAAGAPGRAAVCVCECVVGWVCVCGGGGVRASVWGCQDSKLVGNASALICPAPPRVADVCACNTQATTRTRRAASSRRRLAVSGWVVLLLAAQHKHTHTHTHMRLTHTLAHVNTHTHAPLVPVAATDVREAAKMAAESGKQKLKEAVKGSSALPGAANSLATLADLTPNAPDDAAGNYSDPAGVLSCVAWVCAAASVVCWLRLVTQNTRVAHTTQVLVIDRLVCRPQMQAPSSRRSLAVSGCSADRLFVYPRLLLLLRWLACAKHGAVLLPVVHARRMRAGCCCCPQQTHTHTHTCHTHNCPCTPGSH
jgi:hypothetical protein